jgi:NADH-quinone oxidoreductase subunit A
MRAQLYVNGVIMKMSEVYSFMPIIMLMVFGVLLVVLSLFVGKLIRPSKPTSLKYSPYECGEIPRGNAWASFNMRFYVVGLIFIIFDVESALMFPVAAVFKSMNAIGKGGIVLAEILIFIGILVSGIAYCWKKGDLDWVKSFKAPSQKTK